MAKLDFKAQLTEAAHDFIGKTFITGIPSSIYTQKNKVIADINYGMLCLSSSIAFAVFCVIIVFSLIAGSATEILMMYSIAAAIAAAGIIVNVLYINHHKEYSLAVLYVLLPAFLIVTAVVGTELITDKTAAVFIGLLAICPSLIFDKPVRITSVFSLVTVLFMIMALLYKPSEVARLDCLNAALFYILGMMLMNFNVKNKAAGVIASQQLQWNESRYLALLRDSNDIIFEYDQQNKLCHVSDRFRELFDGDISFEEIISFKGVYPGDHERFRAMIAGIEAGSRSGNISINEDIRFITKSGEPQWFAVYITTLMDSFGQKRRIIGKLTNVDSQRKKEEDLKHLANTDPLTGLYNRAATISQITNTLKVSGSGLHALLLIDLDNLKKINDSFGHTGGDKALTAIADSIRRSFRHSDIAGRIGGDEFMVLLSDCGSGETALKLANKFISNLHESYADDYMRCPVSASVGIALIKTGASVKDPDECFNKLYREADTALYAIKKSTKGTCVLYKPEFGLDLAA